MDWNYYIRNPEIVALYEKARRFDEGEIYQSPEYEAISSRCAALFDQLVDTYGDRIIPMLEKYTECLYEETELECEHFFQEGCLLGRTTHLADK